MDDQRQYWLSNMLNAISIALGIENLQENRAQSRHNDVQAANDRQAEYLLAELGRRFDEQNHLLKQIIEKIGGTDAI